MIEIIVIGILVSLSVLSLGMSIDFIRSASGRPWSLADSGDLDIDLSDCGAETQALESEVDHAAPPWPAPLDESDLEELTEEVRALEVDALDFDLSTISETTVQPTLH